MGDLAIMPPQQLLTVGEVARAWKIEESWVRRLFENEPGVVKTPITRKHSRLLIPVDVFERVLKQRDVANTLQIPTALAELPIPPAPKFPCDEMPDAEYIQSLYTVCARYRECNRTVYFIACDSMNLVKIGLAESVNTRFRSIQAMSPVDLTLLVHIPGSRDLEQSLHRVFHKLRVRGEWFRRESRLTIFIETLLKGNSL